MKHVIVGNGVAGVTAAQAIVKADSSAEVHVFGAEPYIYYRRPLLWELVADEVEQDGIYFQPLEWYDERGIQLHLGTRVTGIDPVAHRITFQPGSEQDVDNSDESEVGYDRLLLATGSRSFVPSCEGTDKDGVFTLRTLDDALAIKAYARKVSRALVIGGGLLGLETARALRATGLDVTVVEFFSYLLPRQLDREGAEILQSLVASLGIKVITGAETEAILGKGRASAIRLRDGREIPGEMVLFSTGVRCQVELAREAGLEVNRGIVADEHLQTSAEDIFTAGDVAEFEGTVYGIIPPAIEQARIAGSNMVHAGSATYSGTVPSTTLKVTGAEVTTLGEHSVEKGMEREAEGVLVLRNADPERHIYRKFVLRAGKIVGMIMLNDPVRAAIAQQLIKRGIDVSKHTDRLLDEDFDLRSLL